MQIYHCRKDEGDWSSPGVISPEYHYPNTSHFLPRIAADGFGNTCVVWYGLPDYLLFFVPCTATGCSYATTVPATNPVSSPAIAADRDGRLHVIWDDLNSLYYSLSTDGGANWSPYVSLPDVAGQPYGKAIRTDAFGNPHVAWNDEVESSGVYIYDIHYSAKTDLTWDEPVNVSNSPDLISGIKDSLLVDQGNRVHIAWADPVQDRSASDVFYVTRSRYYPTLFLPIAARGEE